MANRRECVRCPLVGVPLGPQAPGETVDVSETGLSWISPVSMNVGDEVTLSGPALVKSLGLPVERLLLKVRNVTALEGGETFRVGAELVRPTDRISAAMRRAVLRLQRRGTEEAMDVVDILVHSQL